jgi:hypothetical protein
MPGKMEKLSPPHRQIKGNNRDPELKGVWPKSMIFGANQGSGAQGKNG